jgi:hypothetical protein
MSQLKDVTVRLEALDGGWETCGVDRLRGVHPELSPATANDWGPDTASFELRRDPKAVWPDLGAWTPCEIEIGGVVVWDGRVKETPSRDGADRVMSVQCEGWQYHLDDDVYERAYIHNKLGDWKDARSLIGSDLTRFTTVGKVQTDGAITIGWAKGDTVSTSNVVGVTLDLGAAYGRRVIVNWERTGGQPDTFLVCIGHNAADVFLGGDGFFSTPGLNGEAASGAYSGDSTAPVRYVTIYMLYTGGGGVVSDDVLERITSVQVYGDTSYSAGLKAPTVIADALNRGTPLLPSDRSQIDPNATVAFNIPSLAPGEPRTPREMWEAVNAYHDYTSKIAVGRLPVFKPKPSAAIYEVGAWSPMEFEDASANSGADIYSGVLVTGAAPSGERVSLLRLQGADGQGPYGATSDIALPNDSFDVNTSGWTVFGGGPTTLTRTTTAGEFDSPPAAGKISMPPISGVAGALTTLSGTARAGRAYRLTARVRTSIVQGRFIFGDPSGDDWATATAPASTGGVFTEVSLLWAPHADVVNPIARFETGPGGGTIWVDTVRVEQSRATLVDRRNFRRTKVLQVRSPLLSDGVAATQIADVWLAGHKKTPFKGTVKLTGDQAVRNILTGEYVPLERLLLATDELLRFSDRVDPDTGAWGRDGRIASVSYDHSKNEATVTLDSSRAGFEALLERLAVVTGGS